MDAGAFNNHSSTLGIEVDTMGKRKNPHKHNPTFYKSFFSPYFIRNKTYFLEIRVIVNPTILARIKKMCREAEG